MSRLGLCFSAALMTAACAAPPVAITPTADPGPVGPWMGQAPPGATPTVFAPGLVSTGAYQRDITWTPDGREALWTVYAFGERHGTIVSSRQAEDGSWSEPSIPEIFQGHNSLEPHVTVDGKWLWFASPRPLPGEDEVADWNLWRAPRTDGGWGEPEALPAPVNLSGDEFYPSLTKDGTVYFTSEREGSIGGEDLFRCSWNDGEWSGAENLGPAVNSEGPEFNSFVHPDGDWILFGSLRKGDNGGGDLYISRTDDDGNWVEAEALPKPLNSAALDFCPSLSPDGRMLFFSSRRSSVNPTETLAYDELLQRLESPGNGQCDVYWVDAGVLE